MAQSALDQTGVNRCLFRFFNFSKYDNNKCDNEDSKSDHQCRCCVGNMCFGCVTDKSSHQDVAGNGCSTVEYTAELNKLVTLVTTATEQVKHRVNHTVKNTHSETADKCSDQVNQESALLAHMTTQPLN